MTETTFENDSPTAKDGQRVTAPRSKLPAAALMSLMLVTAGATLQGTANETFDAFFVALALLALGATLTALVFPRGDFELRAFLLTYGLCVLVGGLAQQYSLAAFGELQSTIDAPTFYNELSPAPPFTTMSDMHPNFNSKLAVVIWQHVYAVTWWLGFTFGPYTGVMFNALVVGLSGALTVRTARTLFGDDAWRLRRTGTLFAWCGLFWLFGAILIRDCYTLFLNTVVLWVLIRWLVRPNTRRTLFAAAVSGLSCWAMWYLREEAVVLFGLYGLLAFFCWYWRSRMDLARLFVLALTPLVLLFSYVYLEQYVKTSLGYQQDTAEAYAGFGESSSKEDSLAMRLVVDQPLPIRLVAGTGYLLVFPLPLWAYLEPGANDYNLIKTANGVYQLFIVPLLVAGVMLSIRDVRRNLTISIPTLFLLLYCGLNLTAVIATSLETRHLAQFLPAFLLLGSVPDTREKRARSTVKQVSVLWWGAVIGVHLLWWMARL